MTWVNKVSQWQIKRIIPSHLENNIMANSQDFKAAFRFLQMPASANEKKPSAPYAMPQDLKLLRLLSDVFTRIGVVAPAK
jgi:hypothetical protein